MVDATRVKWKGFPVNSFLKECRKSLTTIQRVRKNVQKSRNIVVTVIKDLKKLRTQKFSPHVLGDLPPALIKQLAAFDQINNDLDREEIFEHVIELTYGVLSENDRFITDNECVREREGYLGWLIAELERIDKVNENRIKALQTYRQHLTALCDHLRKEGSWLAKGEKKQKVQFVKELAKLYLNAEDLVPARKLLAENMRNFSEDAELLALCGDIHAGMLNFEDAESCWQKAIEIEPSMHSRVAHSRQKNISIWIEFGEKYGNEEESGDNFLHLLPVWLKRVDALIGDTDDIPMPLRKLWEKHRENLGTYLSERQFDLVEKIVNCWDVLKERLPEILFFKARVLSKKGNSIGAITIMEYAIACDPDNGQWCAFTARLFLEAGQFDKGIALLNRAVKIDPGTAILWEELGDVLLASGDYPAAATAYENCFLAMPGHYDALKKMGDSYMLQGQSGPAIVAYEAVLAKVPEDGKISQLLARVKEIERGGKPHKSKCM